MEIKSDTAALQSEEVREALLLKRAIKAEQAQQLALIESASTSRTSVPQDLRHIGRLLNEKA